MGKSDLLRVQDVRDAYRLIGECRDLGADPARWHRRMFEGLCRLIGAPGVTGGEGRWRRPNHAVEPLSAFDAGLDARARERYVAFMREQGPAADPIFAAMQRIPGPAHHPHAATARARRRLVPVSQLQRLSTGGRHRPCAHVGVRDLDGRRR